MNREARKKMLIVEGMMHRLELAQATQQFRQDARPAALMSRLPDLLALVARSRALPLVGTALTLVAGKGIVSRLVRRGLVVAGIASALTAVVSRWKSRRQSEDDSPAC